MIASTEFEIFYLKKISYSNYPFIKSINLVQSNISSKLSKIKSLFPNQLQIDYSIDMPIISKLLEPLKTHFETFQFTSQSNTTKTKSIFPSNHLLYISLTVSLCNLKGIFHHTSYSKVPKQKSHVFFIVNKIMYTSFLMHNRSKKKKLFDLNLYKNFNDALDNIKFNCLVIKLVFSQKELIEYMFNNPQLFLLGNEVYNDKILIIATNDQTLNKAIMELELKSKQSISIEVIRVFYVLINEGVITYYEMIALIENFSYDIVSMLNKKSSNTFLDVLMHILKHEMEYHLLTKGKLIKVIKSRMEEGSVIHYLNSNSKYCQDYFCIDITSFMCYAYIKLYQPTNSLMRHYNDLSKQMIHVSFDSRYNQSYYTYYSIAHYRSILNKGLLLSNSHYSFFGYSSKQFHNRACWFINSSLSIAERDMIEESSSFSAQFEKQEGYLSNLLSPSISVMSIRENNMTKRDDYKSIDGKQIVSLCSGRIAISLSKQISNLLNLEYIPSCYIASIKGKQGTWSTYYSDSNHLYYRPSQECFCIQSNNEFEVRDISLWKQGYLTYELVSLLFQLKYLHKEKLIKTVNDYLNKLTSEKSFSLFISIKCVLKAIQKLIQNQIAITLDPMLLSIYQIVVLSNLEEGLKKGKILFEKSAIVKGVIDEYNILQSNEVFTIISKTNNPDDINNIHLKGKNLLAKCNPSNYDDIKCMNFIQYNTSQLSHNNAYYYQKICKLVNVIVFSSKRDLTNDWKINYKGDDEYILFWDETLLPNNTEAIKLSCNKKDIAHKENVKEINRKTNDLLKDSFVNNNFFSTIMSNMLIKVTENTIITKTPHYLAGENRDSMWTYYSRSILGCYNDIIYDKYIQCKEYFTNAMKYINTSIDYKSIHSQLMNKAVFNKEALYYLTKVIQSVFIVHNVNVKLQELMHRYNLSSYSELFVGKLKSSSNIDWSFEGTINKLLEALIQSSTKLLVKDFLGLKLKQNSINEYYEQINISTIALYNVVYNIKEIKLIVDNNQDIILELLTNSNIIHDIHCNYNDNDDDNNDNINEYEYESANLGIECNDKIHSSLKSKEAKIEQFNYKTINQLNTDIILIINDQFGINYCFPYFIFSKYIMLLRQMQHNIITS